MLEYGNHHDPPITAKNIFGPIAVMHVEIHHSDTLQAMRFQRVRRPDRDIIDEAEAHRAAPSGMMAGWADAAKSVIGLLFDHEVGRQHSRPRCSQRRLHGMTVHRGVGIKICRA